MKKSSILFLIALLLASALGYWLFTQKEIFQATPWSSGLEFENISKVLRAEDGGYVLIDQSLNRISKVREDGTYQFHFYMDEHRDGGLYLAKDIALDERGNVYILALVLNSQGTLLKAEEILQYTPQGKFSRIVFTQSYEVSEAVTRPGRIHELSAEDNQLFFYFMSENDIVEEQVITLQRLNLSTGDLVQELELTLPPETFIAALEGKELGEIYYSTKRGELYRVDQGGTSHRLYASSLSGLEESYPVELSFDQRQNVYFVDLGRAEINRIDEQADDQMVTTVLSNSTLRSMGYPQSLQATDSIQILQDQSLVLGVQNAIIHYQTETGELSEVLTTASYGAIPMLKRWLVWIAAIVTLALVVYMIKLLYVDMIRQSHTLVLKQIIIFTPIIVISMLVTAAVVYVHFLEEFDNEIKGKLKLLAHVGSELIDKEKMQRITKPEDFMNEDYRELDQHNHHMLQGNRDLDSGALYSVIYSVDEQKKVRILMLYNTSNGTQYPTGYLPEYDQVIDEGRIITKESQELDGEWLYALAPIYNEQGALIGMQEVGMTLHYYNEAKQAIYKNVIRVILILIPLISLVFFIMTYIMLSSIRRLRSSVIEIAHGNWHTQVDVRTKDEVGELGRRFNEMASQLGTYVQEMEDVSKAYYRFVPEQFLKYLGRDSILQVKLGDQMEEEMVIFIANLRSFERMTKRLTPKESFAYMNAFYSVIGPIIRQNNGIINRYLSAGVMALFPQGAEQALKNAIAVRGRLEEILQSEEAQKDEVLKRTEIGIGIHKGPLMLGVVGEAERMEGNVISVDVNISLILEKYTEMLGASILLSDTAYAAIPTMDSYQYRYLGAVQFPEVRDPIVLYDVFEGDPQGLRGKKLVTKKRFEEGVLFYQEGRFLDARTAFVEVIKQNEQDKAAKLYFALCDTYFQSGTAKEWQGTLKL
ncbi:HAMP domain-containing protein [Bacillus horti]|uniref:Class 3 adenylate cyclase/HAMP domain-containing protein n=1 Tax=Caldalkalibacillus horti TaxID=77523 RepID=A0ABT9VZZ5_9BACI|nr:HAMP domain-containing protein [Bacillus horti]MDQ0166573.1 class 3 adenylate cyclase/HAMP domain-containing protein [Bacillus horti]